MRGDRRLCALSDRRTGGPAPALTGAPARALIRTPAVVLVPLLLLAGCGEPGPVQGVVGQDQDGFHGTRIAPPYDVPAVQLADTAGEPLTLATDERDVDVVFFGYTNCPDVCQVVMGTITSAYLRIPAADRDRVRVVFVTTDPARDDGPRLATYLNRFDPHFTGLTGSLDDIDRLGRPMGIFIKKGRKLPSGGYEVDHTASVLGIAHGKAEVLWNTGASATDMAADIQRLLKD